jgi:tRNA (guanine37-N1)-methyltransferase
MRIDILTLFPEMFTPLSASIIKRATDNQKLNINIHNIRGYSADKHKRVDDYSYSEGAGLVMTAQPIYDCIMAVDPNHTAMRIFMTPVAPVFNQASVERLAKVEHLLLLCGHYEGVDQRVVDLCFDEVLSIGDFVLTGGELPAMCVVDAVARYVDGVINKESLVSESFATNKFGKTLLEYPQYTRPREFGGISVPSVLLNGNHKEIDKWKAEQSLSNTKKFRPDVL